MRQALILLPLALAACAAPGPAPDPVARQEAACISAIAQHIRRSESAVTARFLSETDGIATVETLDGARRHLCMVDAGGRVIDYLHPDA